MKVLATLLLLTACAAAADDLKGWVSDEQCARARERSGTYTATNPECARKCVGEGKAVVLVSEELKKVFAIENPDTLKSQVGNLVQVSATTDKSGALHIEKVQFLETGRAMCGRPKMKQ